MVSKSSTSIKNAKWSFRNIFVLYFTVGGNAGLAAAYSARKLKIPCTIVVPGTTPMFMVERLREEGATVEICGDVSCLYFM